VENTHALERAVTVIIQIRVSQPGFRGTLGFSEMPLGVPREIVIEKKINIVF
jgi:hypothetical protein